MSGAVEGVALLPCPFCAGTETGLYRPTEAREGSGWHDWFVRCHQCHVESAEYETEAEAVTAWNTRTTPPARSYADGDWVLVPREITQAMLDATCATEADDRAMRNMWSELLYSAPKPPAAIRLLSQGGKA